MQIYLIAKIRGGNSSNPVKYRVLDVDSKEFRDVSKDKLVEAIKRNEWAFKNIGIAVDKVLQSIGVEMYGLVTAEVMDEIPTLDLGGGTIYHALSIS